MEIKSVYKIDKEEDVAAELLFSFYRSSFIRHPPIPVSKLAGFLGLECRKGNVQAMRNGAVGIVLPDEKTIITQLGYPETVNRFTIAHELGHWLLHFASSPNLSAS